MNRTVAFHTFGCKLNFSETSTLARIFEANGYKKVAYLEDKPNVFVINTCSVTEQADQKCIKLVKQAKAVSPEMKIVVVGCYAQLKPKEISELKGVHIVLSAKEKFRIFEVIEDLESCTHYINEQSVQDIHEFTPTYSIGDRTRSFLKVQDGCNYNCSFCTIPMARGKSRSGEIEDIYQQAKDILDKGIKEIVISGINIGDYGIIEGKRKYRLLELIKRLDTIEGTHRFRISSIEPNLLQTEIINYIAHSEHFMPHFHIPLQSGSDKILKKMYRRYDTKLYEERITQLVKSIPNVCIGVDVIVGFPSETKEDFEETYAFLEKLPVSYLHIFTYSERNNTPAPDLDGTIPYAERKIRANRLRMLSEHKKRNFYKHHEGTKAKVLFEALKQGEVSGFTENYIKVRLKTNTSLQNTIRETQLLHLDEVKGSMLGILDDKKD